MCGRFTLKTPVADWLRDLFPDEKSRSLIDWAVAADAAPRYNIAPAQNVLVLRSRADNSLAIEPMRWGLIPSWADSLRGGYSMINARSESLLEKTSFRSLVKDHRCVVLADGYYEWQTSTRKEKIPFWIHQREERGFGMASLWTSNRKISPSETLQSVTVITVPSNEDTREVHDRMPAMFTSGSSILEWLTCSVTSSESFNRNLISAPEGTFALRKVSPAVNNVRNEGSSLLDNFQRWNQQSLFEH